MTKEGIVIEIYKVQNQISILEGKVEVDLTDTRIKCRMQEEAHATQKYKLEERLARLQSQFERTKTNITYQEKVDEFYSTPNGIEHKAKPRRP